MGRKRTAARRGFPPNLYQNPDGYFYYRHPDSGKRKGLGYDRPKSFSEARQANAVLAARAPSELSDWATGKRTMTLAAWTPDYKAYWLDKKKPTESTKAVQETVFTRMAAAPFAKNELSTITVAEIAEYLDALVATYGVTAGRVMRIRLRDAFRVAAVKGYVAPDFNPAEPTDNPTQKVKRERLSLEQFWLIHAQSSPWLKNAMMLALMTGQRVSDISTMRFADVQEGFLQIIQQKSQGETRIRQDVRIRLEATKLTIKQVIDTCRDRTLSKFIIHHHGRGAAVPAGSRLLPGSISQAFAEARDKAGIVAAEGRTPPTFHEIRSLSERLYRKEYGKDFAQLVLGHKNASTTAIYDDLRGSGWKDVQAK